MKKYIVRKEKSGDESAMCLAKEIGFFTHNYVVFYPILNFKPFRIRKFLNKKKAQLWADMLNEAEKTNTWKVDIA